MAVNMNGDIMSNFIVVCALGLIGYMIYLKFKGEDTQGLLGGLFAKGKL